MKVISKIIMLCSLIFCVSACLYVFNNPKMDNVSINYEEYELYIGQSFSLNVSVTPKNASHKTKWASSNVEIATVDNKGNVKAVGVGHCVITVTVEDVNLECKVIVNPIQVSEIALSSEYTKISINETMSITAKIYPSNATYKSLTWSSSDDKIIEVDNEGNVIGKGVGTASVTASSVEGVTKTINIEVVEKVLPETIIINGSNIEIKRHTSKNLTYSIYPKNAIVEGIVWSSSNVEVATVSQSGAVSALKGGFTTITLKDSTGLESNCTITVTEIKATTIIIKGENLQSLSVGSVVQLQVSIYPYNSTDTIEDVVWESSDENVVTVSETGKITVVAKGNAVIFAKIGEVVGIQPLYIY